MITAGEPRTSEPVNGYNERFLKAGQARWFPIAAQSAFNGFALFSLGIFMLGNG